MSGKNISDSGISKRLRQFLIVCHSVCDKFRLLCSIVDEKRMMHTCNNRFSVFLTFLCLFQNPLQKLVTDHTVACAPVCNRSVYIFCIHFRIKHQQRESIGMKNIGKTSLGSFRVIFVCIVLDLIIVLIFLRAVTVIRIDFLELIQRSVQICP